MATLEDYLSFFEKGKSPISYNAIRISIGDWLLRRPVRTYSGVRLAMPCAGVQESPPCIIHSLIRMARTRIPITLPRRLSAWTLLLLVLRMGGLMTFSHHPDEPAPPRRVRMRGEHG